ncbi:MAG: universal stress protein UspA-like protein [Frankiales bacterium]|nr:universal stress protein UspA-like protein [Frankiales bacterium]
MRNIVVGVTGRPEPEPALDFALEEALRRRLPLLVVHAWTLPAYGELPPALFPGEIRQRRTEGHRVAREALERATGKATGARTVASSVMVVEGDPTQCLLSMAGSAALLVVGTRGGGRLVRALHGSVAQACLRGSLAPVAVVPQEGAAVPDRWLRSRVLVGLDGSPASVTALGWAVAQAREWGSPLIPVVVSDVRGRAPVGLMSSVPEARDDLSAQVWKHVVEAGGSDLEVHPRFLEGFARERLNALADPHDLLVLGSRGRGTMASALLGSTSTAALTVNCTVVVVREGQARREIHQARTQPMIL